ncbi:uncharacterized protein LOC103032101 [Astyanax mexicanus]|uniref:uncharacterized protein LOC103032101 n=1 Tax=Astyanax mexicanus TaxID=7994 RepID=UPI0020CABC4B|nr:uncharacterized protein LOC103032101 [Astyanax mexicanus]XP_007259898.3 uncharacterized protein LOC103032101 [Astyanax mexicanus]
MEKRHITIQSGSPIKKERSFTYCNELCCPHPHFHCQNCPILFHTENKYLDHLPMCLIGKEVGHSSHKVDEEEEEEEEEKKKKNKTHTDVQEQVGQFEPCGEEGQVIVKLEDDQEQMDQQLHEEEMSQDGAENQKLDYTAVEQSLYGDAGEQGNAQVFVKTMTSVAPFTSTSEPHITIQSGSPIKLTRCFTCCEKFHCPFCKPEVYKPTVESKLRNHIAAHEKRAVHFKGYIIFKCNLLCSPHAHFHCPNCPMLFHKKNRYLYHLPKCLGGKEVGHMDHEEESKTHTDMGEMDGLGASRGEGGLVIVKLEADQYLMDQQPYKDEMSQDGSEDQNVDYTAVEHGYAVEGNAEVSVETMTSVAQIRSTSKLLTVIQSGSPIELARCFTCCKKFHCPFCKPEVYKPTVMSKLRNHIAAHKKRAVRFKGYIIFKCNNLCSPHAHFHCPNCPKIFHKKNRYLDHLPKCLDGKEVGNMGPGEEEERKPHIDVAEMLGLSLPREEEAQILKLEDDQGEVEDQRVDHTAVEQNVCGDASEQCNAQVFAKTIKSVDQVRKNVRILVSCPMCDIVLYKKNFKKHMERKHSDILLF